LRWGEFRGELLGLVAGGIRRGVLAGLHLSLSKNPSRRCRAVTPEKYRRLDHPSAVREAGSPGGGVRLYVECGTALSTVRGGVPQSPFSI